MEKFKIIDKKNKAYPQKLLKIKDAPERLYVMGDEELLHKTSIAIVGSRGCTKYGSSYATKFAKELSKSGICIASGLAVGIDTAAHNGAKKHKGKTIAVIGGGFNKIYPEENIELFHEIIKLDGCIVSEYPPEAEPILSNFPKRNRIISGLSEGVLVVEAIHRSGSTITAKYAYEQGRKVFCIPSNLGITTGVGTNRLIQNGAKLVMKSSDILEELNIFVNMVEEKEEEKDYDEIEVDPEFKEIYNLLNHSPLNINFIAKKINKSIAEVNQKLGLMEIYGYVKSMPGNDYVKVQSYM